MTQASTAATRAADFASGLRCGDVPEDVLDAARLHLLDTLGCALAAVGTGECGWALDVYREQAGRPEASAIGSRASLPAPSAAMANGVAAHALDFDDTHGPSVCHVSAVVAPAALAVAQAVGADGEELLAAYLAGAETVCAIGMAAPGAFHARGFHATSACGVFGAALAAARLIGLDRRRTVSALGIAGSFASGLLAFLGDGSQTKPLHAGHAAKSGVEAALLAGAGAEGPAAVFESDKGHFAALAGLDPEVADGVGRLGGEWQLPLVSVKAYPACHFVHTSVDAAALALARLGPATPADVDSVSARVSATGVGLTLEPLAEKLRPRTPYDAKFSLPFCVSSRLVHGELGVGSFAAPRLGEPEVLALASRFDFASWTVAEAPAPFAGEVTVRLGDGRERTERVDHPRGSAENPMTVAEVEAKFAANARAALPADRVVPLAAAVRALGRGGRLEPVLAALERARAGGRVQGGAATVRRP